ncbi:efflux RND transporter periplasmic adaptor subunit [Candidatus Falkowbacteria bacterium]|nr:efflux RND transporter periplasmic adaptor subunit [Patescibacteria group bacterium]MDD3435144.1 efflux RND transporter periplasmic adaptor subunit [Patescibacteria group bacterium]MDD4466561.1 efflux RND transporter periplasmic adaptor subunit [Patescibacteria group bacterium]NCU43255.1 efflux RND transporter periplasmic adaptor subunit [Candidatus Falkowbacteria bacterium]
MKKIFLVSFLFLTTLTLSACASDTEEEAPELKPVSVSGKSVSEALIWEQELSYPGIVSSEGEAKVVAKTSGTIFGFDVEIGTKLSPGEELGRIDDQVGATKDSFNAGQVKQAQIGVEQAQAAYQLAQTSYENLLLSSTKDLKSAELSLEQATTNEKNLSLTTREGVKSAELAYETAKIAAEQAKNNLSSGQKQLAQSEADSLENATLAVDSAISTSGALLNSINNLAAFDDNGVVSINYLPSLGALESNTYGQAEWAYEVAKESYDDYFKSNYIDTPTQLAAAIKILEETKTAVDATKYLLEKSIPSAALPQTSIGGVSLSGLQQQTATYQTQVNGALAQAKTAEQGLNNLSLNRQSTIQNLEKAYQLAQQQEAAAAQNLNNLRAGNTSQQDQAGLTADLAQNQYENLKLKISSQLAASRSQMENARWQYENAQVSLQSLFDVHSIISPISGTLTSKTASNGDSVSAGQLVATVSQVDKLKVKFYLDAEHVKNILVGMPAIIKDNSGQEYQGVISLVSQQPDEWSHRFLAELSLTKDEGLRIGAVVDVKIKVTQALTLESGLSWLPLSALTVGQNETKILIYDNGIAREQVVTVLKVQGEMAQVKSGLGPEEVIIVDGNKLINPGQAIVLSE